VLTFALILAVISMAVLVIWANTLTAALTFFSLIGYAIIYTVWLKRATPQNIVIGGAAGAAPPVLGWAAVTGTVDHNALILFLIIYVWTPPHFWALAIHRRKDYAAVDIPMLPVTHGVRFTRWHIFFYTILLVIVTTLPYLTGMSGLFYVTGVTVLNLGFLWYALRLLRDNDERLPMQTFGYSIIYLMVLFGFLLIDHYLLMYLGSR
jgi:protoheme IX farnesyltransferase